MVPFFVPLLSLTLAKNNMSLNPFLMSLTIRFVVFGNVEISSTRD